MGIAAGDPPGVPIRILRLALQRFPRLRATNDHGLLRVCHGSPEEAPAAGEPLVPANPADTSAVPDAEPLPEPTPGQRFLSRPLPPCSGGSAADVARDIADATGIPVELDETARWSRGWVPPGVGWSRSNSA